MSSHEPTLLDLRGTFLLPELEKQGLLQQRGNARITHAVPINEEHMIIHTDTSVFLYSQSTREKLWEIGCPSFNFAMDVPHNVLALTPGDATITLWDLCTGQLLQRLTYGAENARYRVNPNGLEFNHGGNVLAAGMQGHDDSVIVLWNTADGHLLRVLPMYDFFADITTLAFHPDGNILAGGSFNREFVWFWSLDDGSLLHIWEPEWSEDEDSEVDRPYDLAFSPDGSLLFVGWGLCGLRVWDVKQEQEIPHPLSLNELQPNWIAVDPHGHFLATIHFGGLGNETLRILKIDSWQTVYEFPGEFSRPFFSLDGQLLAASPSRVGPAHLIDIVTGEERWQING
jgi:WD40 repeat protein